MNYEPIQVHVSEPETSEGVVDGKWMVITEEGLGNVVFYPFDYKERADDFFDKQLFARILFDPDLQEVRTGGMNPLALSSIRCSKQQKSEGIIEGKWMVVTEQGLGNICFYPFSDEKKARVLFDRLVFSRVLLDPARQEVSTGGFNPLSLYNIRNKVANTSTVSSSVW
eukprot:CAMPEP_0204888668 /NCGR_PEP_ID=MMETSP1349-20130617/20833_1 /ASSEMBLY_ACC=CAM_ASM_000710 /TAXON_ID=215587 /ORGANISM="Aplanochytrium stocchinoi, Strain GSBS06" /LENGTH=167 /DNA_ID=CAMNT_0052052261 /DNA_START=169 /DNA_END=669 /DNA_ORIENTATION=+